MDRWLAGTPAWARSPVSKEQWIEAVQDQLSRNLPPLSNSDNFNKDQSGRLRGTVLRDGFIDRITLEKSSGHKDADQTGLDMIEKAGHLPSVPPGHDRIHGRDRASRSYCGDAVQQ
ncbi:energy transducer TonB [Rhizobium sp. PL01]|uniref:energy transducer TonB family protein n=1 Tax=Rhizobium sp. PL01 TaxID=3085631 RepID=UPI00399620A8